MPPLPPPLRPAPPPPAPPLALHPEGIDEFDPELFALPSPPRLQRRLSLVILAVAATAALTMVALLRHDVAYALARPEPVELGDLRAATAPQLAAAENRMVRAQGMLGAASGIRYGRWLESDTFRAVPVAGRRDVWVELRVPAGEESGRWEPPRTLEGRLVRFSSAGPRHRGLANAIARTAQGSVGVAEVGDEGAFLLLEGEGPARSRWALVLAAVFLAFAVWHGATIARMLRRAR